MKTKEWAARRPQHLVARIVCLFLAVITWLCVMRVADPICNGSLTGVSLSVVNSDTVAYTGVPESDTVSRVRVRGTKAVLAAVKPSDVSAYVDMSDLQFNTSLAEDQICEMTVYFRTPEGLLIDGGYTVHVRLKAKA